MMITRKPIYYQCTQFVNVQSIIFKMCINLLFVNTHYPIKVHCCNREHKEVKV